MQTIDQSQIHDEISEYFLSRSIRFQRILLPKEKKWKYLREHCLELTDHAHFCRWELTSLPPQFACLKQLTALNLYGNFFKVFPRVITRLPALGILDLSYNQLTRVSKRVTRLTSLRILKLVNNDFSHIPSGIVRMTQIVELVLDCNHIKKIPETIGNMKELVVLRLENNQITHLPNSIGKLHSLAYLSVGNNLLTRLPDVFNQLTNLCHLNLSSNNLTSIHEISFCTKINLLTVDHNALTSLPEPISDFRLKVLSAEHNFLSTLPLALNQQTNLEDLLVGNNCLSHLPVLPLRLHSLNIESNHFRQFPTFPRFTFRVRMFVKDNSIAYFPKKTPHIEVYGKENQKKLKKLA